MEKCSMNFGKKEHVLNYACQLYQLSRPSKVGAVMSLIRECQPTSLEQWKDWYFEHAYTESKDPCKVTMDSIKDLGERLYCKIKEIVMPEWEEAFRQLTLQDCVDYVYNVTINRTYDGYVREKSVVIDEIRMYADEPDQVAAENLQRNLFPGSALGAPVAGTPESLAPLKPKDLKRYVRSHYRADNTILVVVGSFDPDRAVAMARRSFGRLRASAAQAFREKPFRSVVPESVVKKDVQQTQLALGYRTFGISDPRKYSATVLDGVLGRGMMSRLFQELREKRGISYDISSRMQFFSDAGMFTVTAGMDPSKAQVALKTIYREIERLKSKRVSAAELKRTKEFLVGNFRLSHEKVTSKLFFYGQTMLAFGRIVEPQEQVDGIQAVTEDSLLAVAREIFDDSRRSISWVTPIERDLEAK